MSGLSRILHVDDEPDIREIVRLSLELVGGYSLDQCASGVEALEKVEALAPELIILDVMMPGLDGEQTFKKMREIEALSATPIVFMTARASQSDYQKLRALGAADVLIKPFDPIALPEKVRDIWNSARLVK